MFSRRTFLAQCAVLPLLPTLVRAASDAHGPSPMFGIQATLEQADLAKQAGFQFLIVGVPQLLNPEFSEAEFSKNLERLRASSLPVRCCNSFIRPAHLKTVGPEANHDAVLAYIAGVFKRAKTAGIPAITFGSSGARRIPEGFPREEAVHQFSTLLSRIGPMAKEHGLVVCVEPLRKQECNFLNRVGQVAEVVSRANHPSIGIAADLYHMVTEGDTPDDLKAAMPWVRTIEIAEKEGRRIPGVNNQDFRPFFRVLKTAGFSGTIGFEGNSKPEEWALGATTLKTQWAEA